jgi:uncharacterized protein YjbI with pentapeptide repeats
MRNPVPRPRLKPVAKPHAPILPAHLENTAFPDDRVQSGGMYTGLHLTDWGAEQKAAESVTFDTVVLSKANLSGTRWTKLHLNDTRLEKSTIANAVWANATLSRVAIDDCRLTGLRMNETHLRDVHFKGCKADMAQFRFSKFKAVWFEDCDLRDADFQGADLRDVVFRNCDLTGTQFPGARLTGADLRGSTIEGLRVQPTDLAGVIIDPMQSIAMSRLFAELLGISVIGDDETADHQRAR